jgi:hypothetical protein
MRLEDIISRTIYALDHAPKTLTTKRTSDDGPAITTVREQPPLDVRLMKTYVNAVTALGKLAERPEIPVPPPPPPPEQPWMSGKIQEVVARWRRAVPSYKLCETDLEKFAEDLSLAFLEHMAEQANLAEQEGLAENDAVGCGSPDAAGRGSPHPADCPTAGLPPAETPGAVGDLRTDEMPWSEDQGQTAGQGITAASAASGASDASQRESPPSEPTRDAPIVATTDQPATNATPVALHEAPFVLLGNVKIPKREMELLAGPLHFGPLPPGHPSLREGPPSFSAGHS